MLPITLTRQGLPKWTKETFLGDRKQEYLEAQYRKPWTTCSYCKAPDAKYYCARCGVCKARNKQRYCVSKIILHSSKYVAITLQNHWFRIGNVREKIGPGTKSNAHRTLGYTMRWRKLMDRVICLSLADGTDQSPNGLAHCRPF